MVFFSSDKTANAAQSKDELFLEKAFH